jgi:hypothetical protein
MKPDVLRLPAVMKPAVENFAEIFFSKKSRENFPLYGSCGSDYVDYVPNDLAFLIR